MRVGNKLNASRLWRLLNSKDDAERRTGLVDVIRAFATEAELGLLAQELIERLIASDRTKQLADLSGRQAQDERDK
jgi:hypothetical protein